MILLRYAKCDKSDNKYDSYSDEENECDACTTTVYLLCALTLTLTTWISRRTMT
jgi:hypothetical protein